jgi:GSH-dependent disulfide-bond oxidoreductase
METTVIDLYYFPTPNCHKASIMLEEIGIPYAVKPLNITKGEQFEPKFLEIAPNNRIPVIVDHAPEGSNKPIAVFESGAILLYLAEKTKKLLPTGSPERTEALKWLFWQVAGLGPIGGQNHHFQHYAPERLPYAVKRFIDESSRLYAVLDKHLQRREFIGSEYSIADVASFPWIRAHEKQSQDLDNFPNVKRWFTAILARPAVKRADELGERIEPNPVVTNDSRKFLFGQSASTVKRTAAGV